MNLVNFSHPLSEEAKKEIKERYAPGTDLAIYRVDVQVDMEDNLEKQVREIYDNALDFDTVRGNVQNVDMIILPGLSIVAALLVRYFQEAGYMPHFLVLIRVGSAPPQFMPRHLIRGGGRWAWIK